MSSFIVLGIMLAALFALSYITKRRFGVLGLALCAGAILSSAWATILTPWIESQGVNVVSPLLSVLVSSILVLGPALLLLFSGPTYSSNAQRIIGSGVFAVLAFVFLLEPMSIMWAFDPTTAVIYSTLKDNSSVIIAGGIVLALGDILLTKAPRRSKKQ